MGTVESRPGNTASSPLSPAKTLLEHPISGGQKVLQVPTEGRCKCGNALMPDVEFCSRCGGKRPPRSAKHCYCGNEFSAGEIYCWKCGAPAESMVILNALKAKTQERHKWQRKEAPNTIEACNVDAKLESEFAYMHSLLRNSNFVELVWQEFKDFDLNADNRLDRDEVTKAVPQMVLKHGFKTKDELARVDHVKLANEFFQKMDQDSNENVSAAEFLVYTAYFHYECYSNRVYCPDIYNQNASTTQDVCCSFCKLW